MAVRWLRRARGRLILLVLGLLVVGVLSVPVRTRQGVDFSVSVRSIPLYVKVLGFIDRHVQHELLAREITRGVSTDEARALKVFEWTREHIQPTPPGLPVVDDHILHIIIRGYGEDDQMADVFTTLATYAGVPAFWQTVKLPDGRLVVSFAKVERRWTMFDVAHGLIFRDAQGRLASLEQLVAQPELIATAAGDLRPGGLPYRRYLADAVPLEVPHPLRAELQMPWLVSRRVDVGDIRRRKPMTQSGQVETADQRLARIAEQIDSHGCTS